MRRTLSSKTKQFSIGCAYSKKNIYHVVRKTASDVHTDILVPFGDLCDEYSLESYELNHKTLETISSVDGCKKIIEPIGEFGVALVNLKKVGKIQLCGHFWTCHVLFADENDVEDDEESIVLLKDLLKYYPIVFDDILNQLQNIFHVFEISSSYFLDNALMLSQQSPLCFSPENYLLKKPFQDIHVFEIDSVVGPNRPDKKHNFFKMYLADFVSFDDAEQLPTKKTYKQPVIEQKNDKEVVVFDCSPQSVIDFEKKVQYEIQTYCPDFMKSKHYAIIQDLHKLSKDSLKNEFEVSKSLYQQEIESTSSQSPKKFKSQEKLDLHFRLKIVCEALSVLYGISTDLEEYGLRYD